MSLSIAKSRELPVLRTYTLGGLGVLMPMWCSSDPRWTARFIRRAGITGTNRTVKKHPVMPNSAPRPGATPSLRVAWSRRLTEAEAKRFTIEQVLSGQDRWFPLYSPGTFNRTKG